MGLGQRFDREVLLEQASRARSKRNWRRAIALYRELLAVEPNSIELHERIAPLLAATRQEFDAWNSYRVVAHARAPRGPRGPRDRGVPRGGRRAAARDPGVAGARPAARAAVGARCRDRGAARGQPAIPRPLSPSAGDPSAAPRAHDRSLALRDRTRARAPSRAAPINRPRRRSCSRDSPSAARSVSCAASARRRSRWRPGARSLMRWLTSWRGREERLLELPAPMPRAPPRAHARARTAPARRRDARVVNPVPESEPEDDRSSAAF